MTSRKTSVRRSLCTCGFIDPLVFKSDPGRKVTFKGERNRARIRVFSLLQLAELKLDEMWFYPDSENVHKLMDDLVSNLSFAKDI